MARVGIVTDSTCDLHPSELRDRNIEMAPLKVLFGDESFRDWYEIEPEVFYEKLAAAPQLPKTSQPTPADFIAIYEKLAAEGCESIVSIHLSTRLSGTIESANMAAVKSPVPVHVVDSKTVTHGLAAVVLAAAEARDQGKSGDEVAAIAQHIAENTRLYFVLDTLDYLVKGGRAGKAAGLAASLLNIKPVLMINSDGIIEPFKKVKGRKKAIAELAAHVAEDTKVLGRCRLSLLHGCGEAGAEALRAELDAAGADYEFAYSGLVGSVVGVYAGPNAVGCAYYPIG